ncbi:MAG TPA: hypothetical protein VIF62_30155 [Labilithrix sp.]
MTRAADDGSLAAGCDPAQAATTSSAEIDAIREKLKAGMTTPLNVDVNARAIGRSSPTIDVRSRVAFFP